MRLQSATMLSRQQKVGVLQALEAPLPEQLSESTTYHLVEA
jgi:hypothetical protein